jgi:hypothetical protein
VLKKLGDEVLSIHKRDTVLVFQYSCNGKPYK